MFCFNLQCQRSMLKHTMRFVHGQAVVTVVLHRIQQPPNASSGGPFSSLMETNRIFTWFFCIPCQRRTTYVEMSADALALSFGKFLELKFYSQRYYNYDRYWPCKWAEEEEGGEEEKEASKREKKEACCRHSMHQSGFQFFFVNQMVVAFKYDPVELNEIVTPAPTIPVTKNAFNKGDLISSLRELTMKISDCFQSVDYEIGCIRSCAQESIAAGSSNLKLEASADVKLSPPSIFANIHFDPMDLALMDELARNAEADKSELLLKIKAIHVKISSVQLDEMTVLELFRLYNCVPNCKKLLVKIVQGWNRKLNE